MGGGGKSGNTTVGYKYFAGMHMVLCHGPIDKITQIMVGEKIAWSGNQASSGSIAINQPNLFGGDSREGGIVGTIDVAMGEPTQTANSYLQGKLGAPLPAFRGVVSIILRQVQLSSLNPYIKPWSFEGQSIPNDWYAAKAAIGDDANPAHIIHKLLTTFMGYGSSDIDDASFQSAADALYNEVFGLSFLWTEQSSIGEFIDEIKMHIDAELFTHPRTDKYILKLIRDDYAPANLPVLDETSILSLEEFSRVGISDRVNQVTVTWDDQSSGKKQSVTVQDLALFDIQGGQIIAVTNDYPGISNATLANTVAFRDLRKQSLPLVKVSLIANRQASALLPGDCFKLDYLDLGITGLIMRVVKIDYGTLQKGEVRLEAIQDIFSLGSAIYGPPSSTSWTDPATTPAALNNRYLSEAPYYTLVKEVTGETPSALADLNSIPEAGYLVAMGSAASADTAMFEVWTRQGAADYADSFYGGEPCPVASIVDDIGYTDVDLEIQNLVDVDLVEIGNYAYLGDECIGIDAIDMETNTISVKRGVLDTVPATHVAGTIIRFAEGFQALVQSIYYDGESIDAKLLTKTSKGWLDLATAPANAYTFGARFIRPYPPGNVRVNDEYYPEVIEGELVIKWSHRDRTLQTAQLIGATEGNIGPETGVSYTLRLYDETDTLRRTVSGISDTTYTWTTEISDCGLGRLNNIIRFELESVRNGYISWNNLSISTTRES